MDLFEFQANVIIGEIGGDAEERAAQVGKTPTETAELMRTVMTNG